MKNRNFPEVALTTTIELEMTSLYCSGLVHLTHRNPPNEKNYYIFLKRKQVFKRKT